jgi:hypothetical protein
MHRFTSRLTWALIAVGGAMTSAIAATLWRQPVLFWGGFLVYLHGSVSLGWSWRTSPWFVTRR